MVLTLFLLIPKANHTGVQWHRTLCPHMLHAAHQGNRLVGPGGMRLPLVGHLSQLYGLLRRQHVGFERDDDIDLALALEYGERRSIDKATIFEEQITRARSEEH